MQCQKHYTASKEEEAGADIAEEASTKEDKEETGGVIRAILLPTTLNFAGRKTTAQSENEILPIKNLVSTAERPDIGRQNAR